MSEKDPKKVQLGQRIRELRERKGLTREQLAEGACVSVRAVIQWEIGVREPGWFNILALCPALGVDCRAFAEAPSGPPESRRGRPPKPKGFRGRKGQGPGRNIPPR